MDIENLEPCPFCGSKIRHVTSLAKSFDPPQTHHEWHHVDKDADCYISRFKSIVASATEDPGMVEAAVGRWNRRS